MGWARPQRCWAERAFAEKVPLGAALLAARNWGVTAGRRSDLAGEATAEAFARTWPIRFADELHYRRTLVVTARNYLADLLRLDRRRRPLSGAEHAPAVSDGLPVEALHRCLSQLPDDEAGLIRGAYLDGLTLDQMAERLPPDGRSANARRLRVRSLRLTAERHLADCLRSSGTEFD